MAAMSSSEALMRGAEAPAKLLVKGSSDALVELFTGGDPVTALRNNTREAMGDIMYAPFRVGRNIFWGALKWTGRLAWNTLINLPIWPVWHRERAKVQKQTQTDLASLKLPATNDMESQLGIAA